MNDRQRLRNVALLCAHGLRNLAYYRAGWQDKTPLFRGEFMITVNGNFLDICLLEWCKLFGDAKAVHYWANVVDAPADFEMGLLGALGISKPQFADHIKEVREYRDKFIAHLDEKLRMDIPSLEHVKTSFEFCHGFIIKTAGAGDLMQGLPLRIGHYYIYCEDEARHMYGRVDNVRLNSVFE